jgi:hypothetical protein
MSDDHTEPSGTLPATGPLPASFLNYNGGEKWAGGLRQNVARDRRAAPIGATSLAGVTREVEEEWNQRAAPPLPIRDHAGILIYIKGRT